VTALVAARGFLREPAGAWRTFAAGHVGDVAAAALTPGGWNPGRAPADVDTVLVHPEQLAALGLPDVAPDGPHPFLTDAAAAGWELSTDALGWRVAVRAPADAGAELGRRWLVVVLLGYDTDGVTGPWRDVDEPGELARGLARYRAATGRAWQDSVGRTAESLILSTHPRHKGGTLMDRAPRVPEPATDGRLEQPFTWRRALGEDERAAGYVHAFDQAAQYLAAWGVTELGLGDPEQYGPREFTAAPGLWRLARPLPREDVDGLPVPWGAHEWLTTPTMRRAAELLGEPPHVAEAWVWPRQSRYLSGAYEVLRDARHALLAEQSDAGGRLALDAVKALYRVQTGRLNMSSRDASSTWRRPDWGHALRATARVNLHRRLCKLDGARPFAIATDGLLFATDEPDALAFAERVGLPIGTGLGTFRHEGTAPLSPLLVDELEGARHAPGMYDVLRPHLRATAGAPA